MPFAPNAERMLQHVENPICAGCHRLMDPIGFGLEKYDAIGGWRDKEMVELGGEEASAAPDARGARSRRSARSPACRTRPLRMRASLVECWQSSPICQECVVKQMFRYGFGRPETPADRATVAGVADAFRHSGFKFKEMLIALVRSPQFLEGL